MIGKPLSREIRILGLVIFVGLASYYFYIWRTVRSHLTDFPPMYASARLWQANENVYDINAQCREQVSIRSDLCMTFYHPPLLLPLISLISDEDYVASYSRWCLILTIVIMLCIVPAYLLSKTVDASLQLIVFFPVLISITQGQDTAFVLLAVLTWAVLMKTGKDFWAGLVLTLGLVRPHLMLLLAVPLLFSRTKAFAGFCVGGIAAVLFSWALVGTRGLSGLIQITKISATGTTFAVNHVDMYSAVGIFTRAGLSPYWIWPIFILGIIGISLLWRKLSFSIHSLSVAIVIMSIAAPHLHTHDLSLLGISIYLIHPLAPVLATLFMLTFEGFRLPHLGAYLIMLAVTAFHVMRMRNDK